MQAYNHDQASGSSAWVVSHNLNTDAVAVDVFIDFGGNLEKILPLSVDVTDNNTFYKKTVDDTYFVSPSPPESYASPPADKPLFDRHRQNLEKLLLMGLNLLV